MLLGQPFGRLVKINMVIDYVRVYQNSLGVGDNLRNKFSVYPNPSLDYINIKSEENIDSLELYISLGQLVLSRKENVIQLNVENLNLGVYSLKIYSGNLSTTKKVLIN